MISTIFRKFCVPLCSLIAPLMFFSAGCQFRRGHIPEERPDRLNIEKMVVVGFQSAMSQWDDPDVIRSPISGAVFMAEPVPPHVVDKMTASLFDRILKDKNHELVSPAQARGVYLNLVATDLMMEEAEILQKVGQAFSADAVLVGYIYRWREREGTDFAVNRPASTAFELYLLQPYNGAILWKGRFDKTQKSLSENIFDMGTFLKGRGRWMTVESLAEFGLEEMLSKLPKAERIEEN
jgi:hypothetical protein